jgi:hypothetical protein
MQESPLLGDGTTLKILGDGSTSCKFLPTLEEADEILHTFTIFNVSSRTMSTKYACEV